MGSDRDTVPFLVTAIPYNGIYDIGGKGTTRTAMDMTFTGSSFRFRSNLAENYRELYTYDSANVYFLAPGIFAHNAAQYEFRVLEPGKNIVGPWSDITAFTEPDFQLNEFKRRFAFLGGYAASWDHFLVVELRKKGQQKLLSSATVYWMQIKPVLSNIITGSEMADFLLADKSFPAYQFQPSRWKEKYPPDKIDSTTGLPKDLTLAPTEESIAFLLDATIYKKEALEYRLIKDGSSLSDWQPNKTNNNILWLKNLSPGNYTLFMRYAKQRHNVAVYTFVCKPAWYQTWLFRFVVIVLLAAFFGSMILLYMLRRQRYKTRTEQVKKEKYALELKSLYSQLNPHFIFNALASIQGLINKNNIPAANHYLSDFGMLLRQTLTDADKELVPLDREICTLETYFKLEQLRFNFTFSIRVANDVPTPTTEIPSLLLQPLVENAVKHGVSGMQEKGKIAVYFKRENANMIVCIQDNGKGFLTDREFPGFGLKLTRDRIQLLNEMSKTTAISLGLNSQPDEGTTITILFNNWFI
jgi:hypothetical protein